MKVNKFFGAVAAIVLVCVMSVATALAAGDGADVQVAGETGYIAVKIFDADVNSDGTISNIKWTDDKIKSCVIKGLKETNPKMSFDNAQEVAEYIRDDFEADGQASSDETILADSAGLSAVARNLSKVFQKATTETTNLKFLETGVKKNLDEGYWVIFTKSNMIESGEEGTAPIYIVMSSAANGPITINEKVSPPGWNYEIRDDDGTWGKAADLQIKQKESHRMTFTMPSNLENFTSFYLQMNCSLPEGCMADIKSVRVMAGEQDVTEEWKADYSDGVISVKNEDVLDLNLKGLDSLTVTFDAWLEDGYASGRSGNMFQAWATYSANPVDPDFRADTVKKNVYLYTFDLQIVKKDKETNVPLEGAVFTICVADADDSSSKGRYVDADGQLSDNPVPVSTGKDGKLDISGLDQGTYTITEVTAPLGYQFINADTTVRISADYDESGLISQIGNQVTGNTDAIAGLDSTDDNTMNADEGSPVDADGKIFVTVGNTEMIDIPITGQAGTALLLLAGATIATISALALIIFRKKRKI